MLHFPWFLSPVKMRALKDLYSKVFRLSHCTVRCSSKLVSCPEIAPVNEFSLENYDAIGFDFDHTICKYKLPELFDLIYDSLAKFLVHNCNYPRFLLEKHSLDPHWVQKGIILDKARGNFLKLDKNWRIAKAYHGTKEMSKEAIVGAYGSQCVWDGSMNLLHKICSSAYFEEPFYIFKDYFTAIGAVLCAKIIDHLDHMNKGPLPRYVFFEHYLSALYYIYDRDNFKRNAGFYFPVLKKNPHLFVETCSSELKQWLRDIHKHKKLFVLTSAHSDIFRFLAEICIGEDWRDYFDVVTTYAKKPRFFTDSCPFYALNNDQETNLVSVQHMKSSEIYSQGNWSDLSVLLGMLCDSHSPKALYIGDSMVEDVFAPSHFVGLDTVAIVEEMSGEESFQQEGKKHILHSDTWGSFFSVQSEGQLQQSLWAGLLSDHSKIAVPSLKALSSIDLTDKVPAFSASSPLAGYFPVTPSSCKNLL